MVSLPYLPQKPSRFPQRARWMHAVAIGLFFFAIAGWGRNVAHGLRSLTQGPQSVPEVASAAAATMPPALTGLPPGRWTTAGAPWSLELVQWSEDELTQQSDVVPQSAELPAQCVAEEEELLRLCQTLCQRSARRAEEILYTLDQPALRVRAYVRTCGGRERLVGGYLAYPCGALWSVAILRLQPATRPHADVPPRLLPLAPPARRLAARLSPAGQLQCELVSTPGNLRELADDLRAQGAPLEQCDAEGAGAIFCCRQPGREIYVYARHDALQARLFLVLIDATLAVQEVREATQP